MVCQRTLSDTFAEACFGGAAITAADVIDRFNGLDFDGFHASDIAYVEREKLVVRLSDAMRVLNTTEDSETSDYELQFNRILDGRLDVDGPGLGEVRRCEAHGESELLAEALRRYEHLAYGEAFAHFRLICDRGGLDIIARDFFLTVVNKGTLMRRRGGAPPAHADDGGVE